MNKKYFSLCFQLFFIFFYVFWVPSLLSGQQSDNGYKLKTVVIDAGHGGKDPGSLGKHTTEKEVALAIALKLGKQIEENLESVKVIYTRKTDVFIGLRERAEIANSHKADLFISVHVNGIENHQISGTETLVLGLHRAGENFEVAKKENSVILLEDDYSTKYEGFDPNSPESYQMFSLMQERYFARSFNFAALIQDQFRERAQRKDRGVKQQGLLVLAQTAMPGLMVETGFITNPDEEAYLMSEEGRDYISSAVFRAFREYKQIVESGTSFQTLYDDSMSNTVDSMTDQQIPEIDSLLKALDDKPVIPVMSPVEFKVQIAASSKPMAKNAREFKGLSGVSEYRMGNFYKYAVGSSPTFQEIIPYSRKIKERFPDAFVIAVKDNKIIPLDQAIKETMK
jgi:N-acetylmuramoyl-L-alanine amidase